MRSGKSVKKSFIWVQSHPSNSKRLEIRAIWRLLVTYENWIMDWGPVSYFLAYFRLSGHEKTWLNTRRWLKMVQGLLRQFTNSYPLNNFWIERRKRWSEVNMHIMLSDKVFRSLTNHHSMIVLNCNIRWGHNAKTERASQILKIVLGRYELADFLWKL